MKERLPEESGYVVVAFEIGAQPGVPGWDACGTTLAFFGKTIAEFSQIEDGCRIDGVTHWLPICMPRRHPNGMKLTDL